MSSHTLAVLLIFAIVMQVILVAVDDQPKPRWTPAHTIRTILAFAALPLWAVLVERAF